MRKPIAWMLIGALLIVGVVLMTLMVRARYQPSEPPFLRTRTITTKHGLRGVDISSRSPSAL